MRESKRHAIGYAVLFVLLAVCFVLSMLAGLGCATAPPVVETVYETVEVPVSQPNPKLPVPVKPQKPRRTGEETIKELLILIKGYVENLELELDYAIDIIKGSNKSTK